MVELLWNHINCTTMTCTRNFPERYISRVVATNHSDCRDGMLSSDNPWIRRMGFAGVCRYSWTDSFRGEELIEQSFEQLVVCEGTMLLQVAAFRRLDWVILRVCQQNTTFPPLR